MRLMNIQWIFLDIRIFLLGTHAIFKTLKFLDTALLFSLRLFLRVRCFRAFAFHENENGRSVHYAIWKQHYSLFTTELRSERYERTSNIRRDTRDI